MRGLVLFDIDGTLLRAGDPAHKAAFVTALQQVYGYPATLDGVPLAGMLDSQIARLALASHGLAASDVDARLVEAAALMGEAYAAAVSVGSRVHHLLPGTVALAEHLRDAGFALGVLTGNVRAVARAKLAAAGIDTLLPIGAYGDTAQERAHLVEMALLDAELHYKTVFPLERTVLIGDTPRDIEAARAGGVRVVAVATGQSTVEQLAACSPDAVFPDLASTQAVLATIQELVQPTRN